MSTINAPLGSTLCRRVGELKHSRQGQEGILDDLIARYGEASLRQALLENMSSGVADDESYHFFVMVFRRLGLENCREAVLRSALDQELPLSCRFLFFEILWQTDSLGSADLERFDQRDLLRFHDLRLRCLMRTVLGCPELAVQILLIHQKFPDEDHRAASFYKVDELRREEGLPAATAYRDLARRGIDPLLRRLALEAIVGEGGQVGRSVLQEIQRATDSKTLKSLVQKALRNWPADHGVGKPRGNAGRAFVTRCDERTDVACLIVLPRSGKRHDLFWAQFNAFGLQQAGAMAGIEEGDCAERVREFQELGEDLVAEFPVPQAAFLVTAAWEEAHGAGRHVSPESSTVAACLEPLSAPLRIPPGHPSKALDCEALLGFLDSHPVEAWLDLGNTGDESRPLLWALSRTSAWYQFAGQRKLAEMAACLADQFDPARPLGEVREKERGAGSDESGGSGALLCSA